MDLPYFQFYPQDFISDINVKLMSNEARGAYIMLLCHDWIEGGLPDNERALAILSGAGDRWPEIREQVFVLFVKNGDLLTNPRLQEEREKLEMKKRQKSQAGKASGKSRRAKKKQDEQTFNSCSNRTRTEYEQKGNKSDSDSDIETTSLSPPIAPHESEAPAEPELPPDIERISMNLYGSVPTVNLADWIKNFPPDWIRQAMVETESSGKRSISYTAAILKNWRKEGYPNDGAHARSKTNRRGDKPATTAKPGKYANHPAGRKSSEASSG